MHMELLYGNRYMHFTEHCRYDLMIDDFFFSVQIVLNPLQS